MSAQTVKSIASVLVIGGAVSFLFFDRLVTDSEALTFFYPVDQVLHEGSALNGKRIRMGGHVVKGSIFQKKGTLDYQFEVKPHPGMLKFTEYKDGIVTVHYSGVVPDTFKDDAEVIVVGALQTDGSFKANELIAKCPSKYEAEEKNRDEY
ncbi:MAG: cytochrome c maturation protein CcmE [Myxococcota bacterium]